MAYTHAKSMTYIKDFRYLMQNSHKSIPLVLNLKSVFSLDRNIKIRFKQKPKECHSISDFSWVWMVILYQ